MTRRVTVYKWDSPFVKGVLGTGIFHQFGVNYERLEDSAGNYTTAIVEMMDGSVINIEVEMIVFDNPLDAG